MKYSKPAHVKDRDWSPPPAVTCTGCGEWASARVCPYCHFGPLMPELLYANTTCIALTGARDSGKSVYIAIAYQQLKLLGSRMRVSIDFADDESRALYNREYGGYLLEQRSIIPATTPAGTQGSPMRRPIIISLGVINGVRQFLVLRDIAGESLEQESAGGLQNLAFLGRADTVMFLFDPVKVTTIRDLLHDVIPAQTVRSGDPRAVLNRVLQIIGPHRPRLAVVLGKFDTMESLRLVEGAAWSEVMSNAGAAMLRDASMTGPSYDENDGALLDQEVRSLLLRLNAHELVLALEQPTNGNLLRHRYFAVSVLGEPARSDRVSTRGIKPFRCLDPVRWTLRETGVM